MTTEILLSHLMIGLSLASVLFLITSGLSIIFGLLKIVNFAHASFYALGAYIAFTIVNITGYYWIALIIAPIIVGVVGMVVEYFVIRKTYNIEHYYQLLITFGLVLVFEDIVAMVWGPYNLRIPRGDFLNFSIEMFNISFPVFNLFIIALAIIVAVGLGYLVHKTRIGNIIRASAINRDMTKALGINVSNVYLFTFCIGAAFAGLAGTLAGATTVMLPQMGMFIIIKAFAVLVIDRKSVV